MRSASSDEDMTIARIISSFSRPFRLRQMAVTTRVVSFGGVGSSAILQHIENGDADRIEVHQKRKHCLAPHLIPEVRRGLEVKACFLFGNPYHSVISLFNRKLHRRHERSMSREMRRYTRALRVETTIEEYLSAGVDRFFFEQHLDNWIGYDGRSVRILAAKYEDLADHIDEVMRFLDCERPFQILPRKTRFEDQSPAIQAGLEHMYGELKDRIDRLPSLIRINW